MENSVGSAFTNALDKLTDNVNKPAQVATRFAGVVNSANKRINLVEGAVAMSENPMIKDIKPASAFNRISKNAFQHLGKHLAESFLRKRFFYFDFVP